MPANTGWSEDEVRVLRMGEEKGWTLPQMVEMLPQRTYQAVRLKRADLRRAGELVSVGSVQLSRAVRLDSEVGIFAPEATADPTPAELWEDAKKKCRREVRRAMQEGVVLVQIVTDRPVAFSISSDWHLQRGATDLDGLEEYATTIRDTPGAWAVAVGDLANMPVKWEKATREVPIELELVGHLFSLFGTKLLGATDGNHDAWFRQAVGVDAIKWMAERGRLHYAPDELVWVVELVDPKSMEVTTQYVIATRHKYRRHSNLNYTHSCWRWLEDNMHAWPQSDAGGTLIPDIVAIGDNHVAAVESRTYPNGQKWAARMGPWQIGSGFARSLGFGRTPPTAPTFVLYPHRAKPIAGFEDYGQALEFLTKERSNDAG